jgi:hypothetical protein
MAIELSAYTQARIRRGQQAAARQVTVFKGQNAQRLANLREELLEKNITSPGNVLPGS